MLVKRFDAIVFDWDGTLSDSTVPIAACMQAACRDLGLAVPTLEEAKHVIGLGLDDALSRLLPGVPPTDYGLVVESYRRHYLARDYKHPLYEGMAELLEVLAARGHALAVATGKSVAGLQHSLEEVGLVGRFDALRTADVTAPKPDPTMLLELMEELQVEPGRTLMIGDTAFDLDMAARAGAAGLAVAYGAHPFDELQKWPALGYVRSPAELCDWLKTNA
jgi:phosphoglycolate phosphatase